MIIELESISHVYDKPGEVRVFSDPKKGWVTQGDVYTTGTIEVSFRCADPLLGDAIVINQRSTGLEEHVQITLPIRDRQSEWLDQLYDAVLTAIQERNFRRGQE